MLGIRLVGHHSTRYTCEIERRRRERNSTEHARTSWEGVFEEGHHVENATKRLQQVGVVVQENDEASQSKEMQTNRNRQQKLQHGHTKLAALQKKNNNNTTAQTKTKGNNAIAITDDTRTLTQMSPFSCVIC